MDESVCEQEREKQTLLKVRTHMFHVHMLHELSCNIFSIYAYLMHSFISVLYVFQTHVLQLC